MKSTTNAWQKNHFYLTRAHLDVCPPIHALAQARQQDVYAAPTEHRAGHEGGAVHAHAEEEERKERVEDGAEERLL